ncbi:Proteasome maturation protein [Sarcoptes scabiei]|uniref:Proteasome maturation protein n=1 Tax=Sarcoptes scabiei TaxID=52283 RepID=A0A132A358_SARSC|nr:Proteasome maturation protein [Sarcoptes scabiei]KPM05437.1 proteasome maturation protein-like protein [Sarcoptes scabiei]UXI23313.1 hypothetical protein NH340_JMT09256 [Sarcoptes scabiei]
MENSTLDRTSYVGSEKNVIDDLNPMKSIFLHGLSSIKQKNYGNHPLEKLEKNRFEIEEYKNLNVLRSIQGKQAPLRLLAERNAASKIGRLPFMQSSNLMMDVLTGQDELIMPSNIFNNPLEFNEVQMPAHMNMEKSLNIL